MPNVIRRDLGGAVPIKLHAREVRSDSLDGQRFRLSGASVTIKKPDGTSAGVTNATMTYVQDGEYQYLWDTSALVAGDYKVEILGTVNSTGDKVPKNVIYRLVNQGAA